MKSKPDEIPRTVVTGNNARFVWERRLRADRTVPRYLKGFLLLVGTYMSDNGRDAWMSAATLSEQWENLSRQRVFELLQMAEQLGWLKTEKRPGKTSERLPAIPDPSGTPDGYPSDQLDGSTADLSGSSDPTRQTGLIHPSDPSDPTGTGQAQQQFGGTLPPNPLRPQDPPTSGLGNEQDLSPLVSGTDQSELVGNHQNAHARELEPSHCPKCTRELESDGFCLKCSVVIAHA